MISYKVIEERFETDELGSYTSFGIAAFCTKEDECKQLVYIPDVFTDHQEAEKLAALCTDLKLDPEQLYDVVVDTIGNT